MEQEIDVKKILPQKDPFSFIDLIKNYNLVEENIICSQTFQPTECFFKGHFPNNPIVPGVLQIEAMAQSGILMMYLLNNEQVNIGYLVKVHGVRFYKIIRPLDRLEIITKVEKHIGNFFVIRSKIMCENEMICKSKLVLKI